MPKKSNTKNVDFKETLWKAADKLRNQMDAAEYKHIVLGLIFLKYISDTFDTQKNKIKKMVSDPDSDFFISKDPKIINKELEDRDYYSQDNVFWVPQKARWEKIRSLAKQSDIGSIIDKAMIEIENENKFLKGKLDKRFGRSELEEGKLGGLIDLISTIGFNENQIASDMLGEVYEYFLGKFAIAEGKKGGQFYTPGYVVKILVETLSAYKGRIYDPCCGSGGMFVQSQEFIKQHGGRVDDVSIYGQESNPTTRRLAAMNLAIRGFSADLGKSHGDTFGNDQFPDLKFDYILANPHFNDSDWDGEKYDNDMRWVYGRPSVSNANFAWLQHILWKLKKTGQAGVVLANGSLSAEDEIRKNMIKGDVVDTIVVLPDSLFVNTPIPVCLWFLTNDKTKNGRDRRNKILFIDARNLGSMEKRTVRIFKSHDIKKISNTINSWKIGKNYSNIAGFCKEVNFEEIKNNDFSLLPGIYVGLDKKITKVNDNDVNINELKTQYFQLVEEGKKLDEKIKDNLKKIVVK